MHVTCAIILGSLLFHEYLSFLQIILLGGVVLGSIVLTYVRSDQPHLDSTMAWRGIILTALAGAAASLAFYFFSKLSREIDPFVATYFWETTIGLFSLTYLCGLIALKRYHASTRIPFRAALQIVCISLLTISGTLGYAFAVHHGPYALASGLMAASVLIATLAGRFLFDERPTRAQLGLIVSTVVLIFLLKIVS